MNDQTAAATHTADMPDGQKLVDQIVDAGVSRIDQIIKDEVAKINAVLEQFQPIKHYVWREIEREGEDREPLRVRVLDLTIAQTEAIPWGSRVPLRESFKAIAPYVVEWSLKAEDRRTGEVVPVPPPAEAGWEVFELITNLEGSAIVNWLKVPHLMKADLGKKSEPSTTTSKRPKRKS